MEYEPVIGLEVHAQLLTNSKIFCSCSTAFGGEPNAHTCPGCLGLPGALPTLNQAAVDLAVRLGLALGSHISPRSDFERKHYFYPDLPGGYQTTQNLAPVVVGGGLDITAHGQTRRIRLHHAHLEEDAGKLLHDQAPGASALDLNRAGQGLLEIVSEPELRSADEAVAYLKALREILVYLGVSDGNLEEGSLRCDVNVSMRPKGTDTLGVRAEIKNINSFRGVARAVDYEVRRQTAALADGEELKRQTRLFNDNDGSTAPMREKEEADDYRYLPDPNLPPVIVTEADVARVRAQLPELPAAKRARYRDLLKLPEQDRETLVQEPRLAAYFEAVLDGRGDDPAEAKVAANWILSELLKFWASVGKTEPPVSPAKLRRLLELLAEGRLSGRLAKDVLGKMAAGDRDPEEVMAAENISLVADNGALAGFVDSVLAANPGQAEQLKAGQEKLLGFLVGQVMKLSQGQADPKRVGALIRERLN